MRPLRDFPADRQAFLPVLVDSGADRPKVLITEADLVDYPGLWLRASQDAPGLDGLFAPFPLEEKVIGSEYPQAVVVRRGAHIADTNGRAPLSLACARHRRSGCRPARERHRVPARRHDGAGRLVVAASGQESVGVAVGQHPVRRPVRVGPEHRDIPPLHRFRRQVRHGVPVLRCGLVEGWRPTLAHARARRAGPGARGPGERPRRRALDVGACCGPQHCRRARPVTGVGRHGCDGRLHGS